LKERAAFAAAIAVVAAALGLLAVHNDDAASRWRSLDAAQAAQTSKAVHQVQAANSNISTLNAEVKSLDGQISTMQSQLSDAANQKEKAIDQTTVFKQLLAAAGQVADNLETCITASNTLNADIASAVASNNPGAFNGLLQDASYVQQTCQAAQAGNNALQQAIQSAS
jgi:predicted  nucleic acid-binding Zn-ribbon protein